MKRKAPLPAKVIRKAITLWTEIRLTNQIEKFQHHLWCLSRRNKSIGGWYQHPKFPDAFYHNGRKYDLEATLVHVLGNSCGKGASTPYG